MFLAEAILLGSDASDNSIYNVCVLEFGATHFLRVFLCVADIW